MASEGQRRRGFEAQQAAGNKFANDGSFMELFKKKMEEQQKAKDPPIRQGKAQKESESVTRTELRSDDRREDKYDGERKTVKESAAAKPYQGIVGKRKALMKTIELREKRKRRREELEEQQSAEDAVNRSSAWKAYMAEVKAYEARSCSDSDGHKRPLVK